MDSLTDNMPNPYELVRNRLLETYIPTNWQQACQLMTFPQLSSVWFHLHESAALTAAAG